MGTENDAGLLAKERVLVTGGAGFIGCALSTKLAPRVERYVALDNLHPQVHPVRSRPARLDPAAALAVGDVTSREDYEGVVADLRPTIVVHLAAETGTGQSLTEATRHASVNVVGTTLLTDTLTRLSIRPKHVVLASSRAVYGEGAWVRESGERFHPGARTRAQLERGEWDFVSARPLPSIAGDTAPAPASVYAATKLAQEHVLRAWTGAFGTALSILRFQNVYGPGQSLTNSYTGIVALFSRWASEGKVIPLYEDGQMTRDFVFVEDVADALVATIERPPAQARLCDVGSGRGSTVQEMAEVIARLYGAPRPEACGKFRDGDVRHAWCDMEPTYRELGFRPGWTLERGLAALQKWIETSGTTT